MKTSSWFKDTRQLARVVWLTGVLLLVTALAFGAYYYRDRYLRSGDQSPIEKSVSALESAVREDPTDPDARMALAESYLQAGRYADAISQAQQVLALYPENERALFVAGVAFTFQGKPGDAIQPLATFSAMRSQSPQANADMVLETALYYLGESYVKLNQSAKAIEALTQALQINATDADALYQLGLAYSMSGDAQRALDAYNEAIRFVPDFTEVYQGMVEAYTALGKPDYVAYARGMEAFASQDYAAARQQLEAAAASLPDYAPAHLGLGLTYEQLGELSLAQTSVQRALELDPDNFAASQALGRIQAAMEK